MAVIVGGSQHALAQEAAPLPEGEVIELPGVIVEAPAKRNVKKVTLRKGAQRSGVAATEAGAEPALDQQVVEGEKIVRTVRDTTTSVGVVTGQDIKERQIRDMKEAVEQAANVVTAGKSSGFSVRGLNSEGLTNTQHMSAVPLIGVVIDGATQNSNAVRRGARALWDVEQVEVLRGPQSTLQGRNSLGGHVNVKTNDPTYKLGAIVEGTVGTSDLKSGGFVLNSPIVAGQSAFRISGYKTERERDIRYADPENERMAEDSFETLRGKLLIEPDSVPGLSALFTIARTVDKPGSSLVSGPDFFRRELGYSAASTDFRDATANNYISDISYEFMPGLTIRSVTAFADTETEIYTAEGAALRRDGDYIDGADFTQDLRLEIDNSGNGLSGVLGLFYGNFERDGLTNLTVNPSYFFPGFPDMYIPYINSQNRADTTSIAAYADLRYRLDRWALIAGGRLLRDTVETRHVGVALNQDTFAYEAVDEDSKATFEEFLPKIGVTYDLTDNQTVGVTYNKGYRTGFQQLTPDNRYVTVAPEYLDAYEVSYRSNWLNKTLDFNANAFYYEYTDQQVAVLNEFYDVTEIVNAGASHAYGAELEARWRPIPPLQVFASLGLMQTKFDDLVTGQGNDFSGNEYPHAPAYTFTAGAMYRSSAGWFAGANVRHVDGYYSQGAVSNENPRFYVDGYTVVDARAGWEWEHYTLTLFAKNLFDEKYLVAVDRQDSPPLSSAYGIIGDERQIGVTLTGRF